MMSTPDYMAFEIAKELEISSHEFCVSICIQKRLISEMGVVEGGRCCECATPPEGSPAGLELEGSRAEYHAYSAGTSWWTRGRYLVPSIAIDRLECT